MGEQVSPWDQGKWLIQLMLGSVFVSELLEGRYLMSHQFPMDAHFLNRAELQLWPGLSFRMLLVNTSIPPHLLVH